MNHFGLTAREIELKGAQWTVREIVQQPDIWQEIEKQFAIDSYGVADFLAPLMRRADLRIVLTGAGTSAFIGECLAPAMFRHYKRWIAAVSTTDLAAGPGSCLLANVPTLLLSFARSGNSPESEAALDIVERCVSACYHLIVTCNADGTLYQRGDRLPNARVIVLPEATNDRSFAMTSSFSAMLLAAALAFKLPLSSAVQSAAPIGELAQAVRGVRGGWLPRIQSIVGEKFERVIFLGANELKGLARESALKMLELTDGKIVSVADTPLGFRHGPKTIVNRRTLVVLFLSNDAYARRYDLDLLAELRADAIAGRVLALTARRDTGTPHPDDIAMPALSGSSDLALCLPFAVFAQSLALMHSLSHGIRPDTPNAAGVVSRVVQGVSIYPLERSV